MYSITSDTKKDSLNKELVKYFSEILSSQESFFYTWPLLDMIGKARSSDDKLNVYSWHIQDEKSNYIYYSIVQQRIPSRRKGDAILIHSLSDKSDKIKSPENQLLDKDNWYGALYYSITPFSFRRDIWYILLGFDFNTNFSNKKIIEILKSDNNTLLLGGEIRNEKDTLKRLIFEYSSHIAMTLRYDDKLGKIVFDHLRPLETVLQGNYRFYVPDGSYDALRFYKGAFILERDVDARNY